MKRILSSMIVALFATMQVMAQTSSATLTHDGKLSSFTGENALSEALEEAADGDLITLSAGTFKGCTIRKAITLRGAGMEADELGRQTTISSDLNIYFSTGGSTKSFSIEGVFMPSSKITCGDLGSFYMNKCTIKQYTGKSPFSGAVGVINQTVITNCKIGFIESTKGAVNVYNSLVVDAEWASSYRFDNCVVLLRRSVNYYGEFNNSILLTDYSYYGDYFYGTADHCAANFTIKADRGSNNYETSADKLFSNYDSNATWYTRDLTLKDEAKAKYLGSDGTEVGIYGGNMPFSPFLDQPFIKRLKVAPRSSRDGKLSVDIEVSE